MTFKIPKTKEKESKESFRIEKSEYDKQADKFLKNTNSKFSIRYVKHDKYFPDDKEARDIYRFRITKDGKVYSGTFGQSIAGSQEGEVPSAYSVLSSLSGSAYDSDDSFEGFCSEYGYDTDSMKAFKIYKAVQKERAGLRKLYSQEELNKLSEIQ